MTDPFRDRSPLSDSDRLLLEEYRRTERSLDSLAYTPEFEQLFASLHERWPDLERRDVFRRLLTLRKAGHLPRTGQRQVSGVDIEPRDESVLTQLVVEAVGSTGRRDQLPYTEQLDRIVTKFNELTERGLDHNGVWQVILRLAK